MTIDNELIDELLRDYKKPEDLIGENGLLKQLTKRLLERAMSAELTEHVGYEKHDPVGNNSGNSRSARLPDCVSGSIDVRCKLHHKEATACRTRLRLNSRRKSTGGSG